jgi:D-glucuronyl C5-epimerase-like protein
MRPDPPTASAAPSPSRFPAQSTVPRARPAADATTWWTDSPIRRRPLRVRVTGWPLVATSWGGLPYMARTAPALDLHAEVSDARGVCRHHLAGRAYDHPVLQARVTTGMLAGFRLTQDRRYLERAYANSLRLLETAVHRRGALYLPYRYRHRIAGATILPIWYSAMAQGLALSAVCRMHYVTGDHAWLDAAHQLFASFLNPPLRGQPWTVHTDRCGHLWLEEYPNPLGSAPMRVLNGHVFAAIGVYDYLWLTGSPRAAVVLDAALTTIADHGPEYRVPGGCSYYSLTRPVAKPAYHPTHVWQLARLGAWTGDQRFLDLSAALAADFPPAG